MNAKEIAYGIGWSFGWNLTVARRNGAKRYQFSRYSGALDESLYLCRRSIVHMTTDEKKEFGKAIALGLQEGKR
jgi:hypothetical protein